MKVLMRTSLSGPYDPPMLVEMEGLLVKPTGDEFLCAGMDILEEGVSALELVVLIDKIKIVEYRDSYHYSESAPEVDMLETVEHDIKKGGAARRFLELQSDIDGYYVEACIKTPDVEHYVSVVLSIL